MLPEDSGDEFWHRLAIGRFLVGVGLGLGKLLGLSGLWSAQRTLDHKGKGGTDHRGLGGAYPLSAACAGASGTSSEVGQVGTESLVTGTTGTTKTTRTTRTTRTKVGSLM